MTAPEFLEADVVLFLHDQALRDHGGVQGLRDEGLLHAALARPLNRLAYAAADSLDLFDLAAAYAYALARTHAFSDANKRTAWACCVLFLRTNGVAIDAATPDVVDRMPQLAAGALGEADFAAWLRERGRETSSRLP